MNKLRTNKDYFDSKQIKAIYIIQRMSDETTKHINLYRIINTNYFIISKIIFKMFKEIYEDIDKLRKI